MSIPSVHEAAKNLPDCPDVQQEHAETPVAAGVAGLRLVLNLPYLQPSLPVRLSILTSTGKHRGVHMSRMIEAANNFQTMKTIEDYLFGVCRQVDSTQKGTDVECEFELPCFDQFARISVRISESEPISYRLAVSGITSCPCSRRTCGVGHMQRATLELEMHSTKPLSTVFFQMVSELLDCFSARPKSRLKRFEEANEVIAAQENSRFVEDVIRECLGRFPNAEGIEARAFESVHVHDAVARWRRGDVQQSALHVDVNRAEYLAADVE